MTLTLHAIQFTLRAQFRWNLSVFNKPFEEKYWIGSFFNIITKSIPESYLSSKAPFTLWKQQLNFCQHWFGWEFLKIQTQKTYWFCIDFFWERKLNPNSTEESLFLFILIENWKIWLLIMEDDFWINLVLFWKWKSLLFNKKKEINRLSGISDGLMQIRLFFYVRTQDFSFYFSNVSGDWNQSGKKYGSGIRKKMK